MTERLTGQEAERAVMLGGVSHDLRTPLTRLRLCLEMMHGSDAELEATALRQVDWIETMLAQFLDFARGFDAEPLVACDIAELIAQVAADHGQAAVQIDVQQGLGAILRPNAVARAINNIVTNALRHGAPPVRIEARQYGNRLHIAVSDGGPGIDLAHAQDLARPFARGDAARSGEGAGLGLAIAERVAAAHGGSLGFGRSAGRFTVLLEISHPQATPPSMDTIQYGPSLA
jgi:two-component system osmolarity sensor histidine kinase EnvZ